MSEVLVTVVAFMVVHVSIRLDIDIAAVTVPMCFVFMVRVVSVLEEAVATTVEAQV